jgi:hypothetical protein
VTERDGEGESFVRERRKYLAFNEVREDNDDGERGARGRQENRGSGRPTVSARGGGRWPSHHGVAAHACRCALAGTRGHGPARARPLF